MFCFEIDCFGDLQWSCGDCGFIVQLSVIFVHVQYFGVGDFPSVKRSSALVSFRREADHSVKTESGIPQGRQASLPDHSHSLTTHEARAPQRSGSGGDRVSALEDGTAAYSQRLYFGDLLLP